MSQRYNFLPLYGKKGKVNSSKKEIAKFQSSFNQPLTDCNEATYCVGATPL